LLKNTSYRLETFAFGLGLLTFIVLHEIEVLKWASWFGNVHEPWFLNDAAALLFMLGGLFGVSVIAGLFRVNGVIIAVGASVAMIAILLLMPGGPGTIFPIVIVFGSIPLFLSALMGWGCALLWRASFPAE
jgi:hypothetical protein